MRYAFHFLVLDYHAKFQIHHNAKGIFKYLKYFEDLYEIQINGEIRKHRKLSI